MLIENFKKELCEAFRFCEGLKLPKREYQGKIIYPETSQGAYFMYDNKGIYIDKTAFMITTNSNPKFLLALLNSKALTFYYKNFCGGCILGNTAYQYNKHALERLPIPQITESNQPLANEIIKCVDKILEIKAYHTERELVSQNIETELVILSDSEKSKNTESKKDFSPFSKAQNDKVEYTKNDTSKLESKIDSLVYKLYNLSDDEIATIES